MKLIDCHAHSEHSVDANFPIDVMCEAAMKCGLSYFAITDHCELNRWYEINYYGKEQSAYEYDTYLFSKYYESSLSELVEKKKSYKGRLKLLCGIELGQAIQDIPLADKIALDPRLDFIIGSIHEPRNNMDFAFIDYTGYTQEELEKLLEQYFLEINELCEWGKFQILGHLTYTMRYIEGKYSRTVNLTKFDDIIANAFKAMIRNECALEINTSGIRQAYGKPFPELKYVKLYRDLGGEMISLGSDAHYPEHVGANISDGAEIAHNAGFDKICVFENKKPHFIALD